MTIKVVEYIHEYEDTISDFVDGQFTDYPGRVRENYYAIGSNDEWNETDSQGNWKSHSAGLFAFTVNGTTLRVYSRSDVEGYIALLTKLRDEFPEKER